MTETKPKSSTPRVVPRILWSNRAYYRFTGQSRDGFTAGEGYMIQALRVAQSPQSFLDIDVEKAARILKATRVPNYVKHSESCMRVLEERRQTSARKGVL